MSRKRCRVDELLRELEELLRDAPTDETLDEIRALSVERQRDVLYVVYWVKRLMADGERTGAVMRS